MAHAWYAVGRRTEAQDEQRDADGDGGVGDVEGGPVPAVIVDVHEVHDGAEPGAVDQIAHRSPEDERRTASRSSALPGVRIADGHAGEHDQRPQRQDHHEPPPRGGQARQQPEGQARIEHQREGQQAVDRWEWRRQGPDVAGRSPW